MTAQYAHESDESLFALIRERMPDPAKVFLKTETGRRLTYGDMLEASGRVAHTLVRAGVEPGDRVAVQTEKSPEALILYLAALRAGAVYLPLNTAYTLAELDYFIGDAAPRLVVCDPAKRDGLAEIAKKHNTTNKTHNTQGRGSLIEISAKAPADFADVP